MKLITLQEWANNHFSVKFGDSTLSKWARDGLISPPAKKIGKRWMVHPAAQYVETTIEAQRTEHAQKELKQLKPTNIVLSEKLLRIVNNVSKAA
ncbi:excisionase [Colwellia sp. E150_009]